MLIIVLQFLLSEYSHLKKEFSPAFAVVGIPFHDDYMLAYKTSQHNLN